MLQDNNIFTICIRTFFQKYFIPAAYRKAYQVLTIFYTTYIYHLYAICILFYTIHIYWYSTNGTPSVPLLELDYIHLPGNFHHQGTGSQMNLDRLDILTREHSLSRCRFSIVLTENFQNYTIVPMLFHN